MPETTKITKEQATQFLQQATKANIHFRSVKMSPLLSDVDKALMKRLAWTVDQAKDNPIGYSKALMQNTQSLAEVAQKAIEDARKAPPAELEAKTEKARMLVFLHKEAGELVETVGSFIPDEDEEEELEEYPEDEEETSEES